MKRGVATCVADLIAPGLSLSRLHFPEEELSIDYSELWDRSAGVDHWCVAHEVDCLAMMLSNSSQCASALLGSIQAGISVASIPPPARGVDLKWYSEFVSVQCKQAGATTIAVDYEYEHLLEPLVSLRVVSFRELVEYRGSSIERQSPRGFQLTQFTSGSSAAPKGVVLDDANIASNISSILEWLQVAPGDCPCSWLPLSHDMGLIGMFLTALAACGPAWGNGMDIVLSTPESFLRRPQRWLEQISHFGATITCAPSFALDMLLRRPAMADLSLGSIRTFIVGSELVRAESLRSFSRVFQPLGFRGQSFSPAYGMAESTLAVSATPIDSHWTSQRVDPFALADGGFVAKPDGVEIVGCGKPLRDVEVGVTPDPEVGELLVRGPSVARCYADGTVLSDDDGWFATRDLGIFLDDELYVVGRRDGIIQVAGRNVYGSDVESAVASADGIHPGRLVAVSDEAGRFVIVAECSEKAAPALEEIRARATDIRNRVLQRVGVAPRKVILVERGRLPVTTSGKNRPMVIRAQLLDGTLRALEGSLLNENG